MSSEAQSNGTGGADQASSGHGLEMPQPAAGEGTALLVDSPPSVSTGEDSPTVGSLPNGGADYGGDNGRSAESTPTDGGSGGGAAGGEGGGSSVGSSDDELERPWPATFGRTISILAGPHVGDADFVDKATKSPKLTPNLIAFRREKKRFRSMKGSVTPEPHSKLTPFKKGMPKYHSLDWKSKSKQPSAEVETVEDKIQEHERKALEAKAYRQKILSKAGGGRKAEQPRRQRDEEAALMDSPGLRREVETDKRRKEARQEEEAKAKVGDRDASFSQCCFNMSNILMGVGMLGLPFVFKSAGWIGGFFVTFFFGAVTWRTSVLIGRELNGDVRPCHAFDDSPYKSPAAPGSGTPGARMRRPLTTFPDIAREAFGENGCVCLSSVLYFELFSCLCIFFVTLGDHLHTLFPDVSEERHMIIVAIVLTLPTALLRTPRLLSYLSAVGTFATVAVVLAVVLTSLVEGDITEELAERNGVNDPPYHILWRTSGLPVAFGLIAYTFSGHAIVPSIYSSMKRPQDFERMIDATFLVVISCCLLVAVSGYIMFGSFVDDQITISLKTSGAGSGLAMTMLTWLMILTAFSKFTLTMFPLAIGIEEIVAPCVPSEKVMETASALIKLVLIVLALVVAIFVPSFSFLCSLVGLICTMIVSAIFPAAAHLKLFGEHLSPGEKILDWFFVIGGSVMAVVGTVATIGF